MTMPANNGQRGVLLEAEVAPGVQQGFEERYRRATGQAVSPGRPEYYQSQLNKWGAELRVYFNDPDMATDLRARDFHVEDNRTGYRSDEYQYRVNDNDLWWTFVEQQDMRLGPN